MDVADKLIDKIFSFVDLQKECARKMKKLADEMEENKKAVNVSSVVGSSLSVGGAAALTSAGAVTLLTGGLAIPFLAGGGAIVSGVGAATSIGSAVADAVISSSAKEDAEKIVEKIKDLKDAIQELMNKLAMEGQRRLKQAAAYSLGSPVNYVLVQILRALGKRHGLKFKNDLHFLDFLYHTKISQKSGIHPALDVLEKLELVLPLLTTFVKEIIPKKILEQIAITTAKDIAFQAAKQTGSIAAKKGIAKGATSLATKTTAKALGKVGGGAVGLLFSVPELIIDINNIDNCETEVSQNLRKQAKELQTVSQDLEKELDKIKETFQRLARDQHTVENANRSSDDRKRMIKLAIEKCKDEAVKQWLRENSQSVLFFHLVNMFHYLKEHIEEEEEKDHSHHIDIVFVAHGCIRDPMIPASCLLPLPSITDVLLYSPWNCPIDAKAAYGIATGRIQPGHRKFICAGEYCRVRDEGHHPIFLPDGWNSMKRAGYQMIPNIMLSPLKQPKDGAWEAFVVLKGKYGEPGRNRVVIPFIVPEEYSSLERVPFYIVTLALSLVLSLSRFKATIHLAACLGKRTGLNEDYLRQQYAYTIDNTAMTCSPGMFDNRQRYEAEPLYRSFKAVFG